MFRYLALSWDDKHSGQRETVRRFVAAMQCAKDWQSTFDTPGMHAFMTGGRAGGNNAFRIGFASGVVLGKLFHQGPSGAVQVTGTLRATEQNQILRTGGQALVDDYWGCYIAFLRLGDAYCVVRDPIGGLPCFRLQHEGICIVFSWLEDVLSLLPGIPVPNVAWDCLAAHIASVSLVGRETVLNGVTQVLPGERVSLFSASPSSTLLWSAVSFAATPIDAKPSLVAAELKSAVQSAVRTWAGGYDRILLRLSGGLDSTILLGCLADATVRADVTCVNYHSIGSNSDERAYARVAALTAGRSLIERERNPCYPLERIQDVARTPFPSSYLGRLDTTSMDARLAKELSVDAMFTGGGGDQLFFQFRDWWSAADYLQLRGLDAGFWGAAMDSARLADLSVWHVLKLALRDRFGRRSAIPETPMHLALAMHEALPDAEHRRRFEHPTIEASESLPLAKRMHVQLLLAPADTYDPYEKEAAPEIVNPLLSQPVLERCLAIPSYMLVNGGQPRALARQAFAGDIPQEIATRHSKGGMEEHIVALLRNNLKFARELLLDGQLVRHGLVDRRKVEAVLSDRPTTLAAHTAEIHIYLGIEAWLQRMTAHSPISPRA